MHPNPHVRQGLQRPSPNSLLLDTVALRASRASLGASIVPQCLLAVDDTVQGYVIILTILDSL